MPETSYFFNGTSWKECKEFGLKWRVVCVSAEWDMLVIKVWMFCSEVCRWVEWWSRFGNKKNIIYSLAMPLFSHPVSLSVSLSTPCGFSSRWGLFPGASLRRVTGVHGGRGVPARCALPGHWIHPGLHLHGTAQTGLEPDLGADRCTVSVPAAGGAVAVHRLPAGTNGWEQLSRRAGPRRDLWAGPAEAGCRGVHPGPLPGHLCRGEVQRCPLFPPGQVAWEGLTVCREWGNVSNRLADHLPTSYSTAFIWIRNVCLNIHDELSDGF